MLSAEANAFGKPLHCPRVLGSLSLSSDARQRRTLGYTRVACVFCVSCTVLLIVSITSIHQAKNGYSSRHKCGVVFLCTCIPRVYDTFCTHNIMRAYIILLRAFVRMPFRLRDSGTKFRGYQLLLDFTVLFAWNLATAGLPATGFNNHGIQRDILYEIWLRQDSTGLFVRDPATAVLLGTGSSHDGTIPAERTAWNALKIFLTSPGFLTFHTRNTAVLLCVAHFFGCKSLIGNTKKQRHNRFEVGT